MATSDFESVFGEWLGKVKSYSSKQRLAIMEDFQAALDQLLEEAGAPKSDGKSQENKQETTKQDTKQETSTKNESSKDKSNNNDTVTPTNEPVSGGKYHVKIHQPAGGKSSISFGDDNNSQNNKVHTSVRTSNPSGGKSSISFGDDNSSSSSNNNANKKSSTRHNNNEESQENSSSSKHVSHVKITQPSGGKSSINFSDDNSSENKVHTSVKTSNPSGGKSTVNLGNEERPTSSSSIEIPGVNRQLLHEISTVVYRAGKLKGVFEKMAGFAKNKGLSASDLKEGVGNLGVKLTDEQCSAIHKAFSSDTKVGITYSDFVRLMGNQ